MTSQKQPGDFCPATAQCFISDLFNLARTLSVLLYLTASQPPAPMSQLCAAVFLLVLRSGEFQEAPPANRYNSIKDLQLLAAMLPIASALREVEEVEASAALVSL